MEMLISPAFAHGTGSAETGGAIGPLILLGVAILAVIFYFIRKKWLSRRTHRDGDGN